MMGSVLASQSTSGADLGSPVLRRAGLFARWVAVPVVRGIVAVSGLTLVVAGCSSSEEVSRESAPEEPSDGAPVFSPLVLEELPPWFGIELEYPGLIIIDEMGCLAFDPDSDDPVLGILLPPEAEIDAASSPPTVTLSEWFTFQPGDRAHGMLAHDMDLTDRDRLLATGQGDCTSYTSYTGVSGPPIVPDSP